MKQFLASLGISAAWVSGSTYLAMPWFSDIANVTGIILASIIVLGIAIIPGLAMSFVYGTVFMDRRHKEPNMHSAFHPSPDGITVLVAAYNEQNTIYQTLNSIYEAGLKYDGDIEVIVCDDGSVDDTKRVATEFIQDVNPNRHGGRYFRIVSVPKNVGKANVLNVGLKEAVYDIIVTVDADTILEPYALNSIVASLKNSEEGTAAVAGTVFVKNGRKNWITRLQEWDYLIGISAIKQSQSAYNYTLVAQGAFSVYYRKALEQVEGWPDKIGEDIVLTWKLLRAGYKVGHDQNAIVYTNVPETYRNFFRQRKRWSAGLIESFKTTPGILFNSEKGNVFVYYNAFFPLLDFMFMFVFVPSIIAAIFFQLWVWYLMRFICQNFLIRRVWLLR